MLSCGLRGPLVACCGCLPPLPSFFLAPGRVSTLVLHLIHNQERINSRRNDMASYNRVILMGNLTRDPEMRFTQGESSTAICKIGMAVNRRFKNRTGEWGEKPTFVDVTLFGNRAEAFEKYHRKGSMAFIEGRLEFDSWEDKNSGQKRSKLYVVAENWEFAGGRGDGGGGRGGNDQGGAAPQQQPADEGSYGDYSSAPSTSGPAESPGGFDDTPF